MDAVTLAIEPGQTLLLCGPNGAGKSTLLKVAAGLVPPSSGEVLYDGRPLSRWGPGVRRRLGVLFHESLLYDELTVLDNLVFAARLWGVADARGRAEALVDEVGLRLAAREPVARLSRGMRQRLALARALVHQPEVLLLDEPFAGLDARWAAWLRERLAAERRRGTGIVLVVHEWRWAWPLADRAAVIVRGRLQRLVDARAYDADRFGAEYGRLMVPSGREPCGSMAAGIGPDALGPDGPEAEGMGGAGAEVGEEIRT